MSLPDYKEIRKQPRRRWRHRGSRGGKRLHFRPNPELQEGFSNLSQTTSQPHVVDLNRYLHLSAWNARSIRYKTTLLADFLIQNDIDVMFLTETWINENDDSVIRECTPPFYSFSNFPRGTSNHGGIGIISKDSVNLRTVQTGFTTVNFEHASVVDLTSGIQYIVIYRPPPSSVNRLRTSNYLTEFDDFIGEVSLFPNKVVLLGDLNIHVNEPWKSEVKRFIRSYETAGFYQYAEGPTHISGNTIDLFLARLEDGIILRCESQVNLFSDHFMMHCYVNRNKPTLTKKSVKVRNFKEMDQVAFQADVTKALCTISDELTLDELVTEYDSKVITILDQHAPTKVKVRTNRPRFPWYSSEIKTETQVRRKYERRWRKSRTSEDRKAYIDQKQKVNQLIETNKTKYYKDKLSDADTKGVFKTVNNLLNKDNRTLPSCDSTKSLCHQFANYFEEKVSKIRNDLDSIESETNECTFYDEDQIIMFIVLMNSPLCPLMRYED
ncbi:uncharacterized protein [Amphiura filiformis]|uniref:uncharacterized protein n=1 Tax=Amphiura filiformis TaxID=82378 RepID=UPI003B21F589